MRRAKRKVDTIIHNEKEKKLKKKLLALLLISTLLIVLIPGYSTPILGNDEISADSSRVKPPTPEETKIMIERVKAGIDKPLVTPRDQWPDTPRPLNVLAGLDTLKDGDIDYPKSRDANDWYAAGMRPYYDDWSGFYVEIKGAYIDNDDPDDKEVRLTPHLVQSLTDYIAIVLDREDDDDILELWTFDYCDSPQWEYHRDVSDSDYFAYYVYIDEDDDYYIWYSAVYPAYWTLLRSGSTGDRECYVEYFLEHWVPTNEDYTEHGISYWREMMLIDGDGDGIWWDDEISTDFFQDEDPNNPNPLDEYHWESGNSYKMNTYSAY